MKPSSKNPAATLREATEAQLTDELLAAQENLITLIDALPDNVIFKDAVGRWLVVNPPAVEFFQLKGVPWIGKTDAELAKEIPALKDLFAACTRSDEAGWAAGKLTHVTERGPGPDGRMQEHEVHKVPLFNPDGSRHALLIVGRDVTEKRRLEKSLKLSELMASQSRDVLLLVRNRDGQIMTANASAVEFYGYTPEELLTKTIYDLRQNNNVALAAHQLSQAFASGILFETVHVHKDGHTIPVEVSSRGVSHEGEEFLISSVRDISIRKEAKSKLLQLEQSMAAAANGIFLVKPNGKIFWANEAFTWLTGYTTAEVLGQNPSILKSGRQNTEFYREMWHTVLNGKVWQGEIINRRKDGTFYTENKTITPVRDAAGQLSHFICVQEDITARKQVEHLLIASENKFRGLYETITDGIVSVDMSGQIREFNSAYAQMLGYSDEELLRLTYKDLTPEKWQAFEAGIVQEQVLSRGFSEVYEKEYRRKDGTVFPVELRTFTIKDEAGQVAGMTVFVIDITERKRAEAAIIGARDFHLQLLENAPALIWRASTDAKCDWFNATWLAFTGRPLEQELGDGWAAGVHPDDLDDCVKRFLAHFEKREPFMLEYRLRRHDSEYRWIADYGQPFELPGGGFGGYIGYCYDIHDTRQAKELLELRVNDRTREIALLSEVIDQSSVAFSMSNPDGSFITFNEAFTRLTGYTSGEILGNKLNWNRELTPPEWRAISAEKLEECLRNRLTVRFEKEYLRKDGSRVPVEVFVQPMYDSNDILLHLRAFITDITERKQAEAALQKSQARERLLADVIDTSDVAFCTGSPYGGLTMVNQAFEKLTGYSRTEVKAKDFSWIEKLTPPKWRDMESKLMEECVRLRQPVRYEKEYIHKDGHHFPVELFVQPVFDSAGEFINCRVFLSDISERKKAAEALATALQEANRANRAKSEFLAHMSHEIRTPMNIILGNTQLLQREMDLPEKAKNKITTINRSGEHLLTILNEILDLAKVESGQMEVHLEKFGLNRLLDDLNHLFHPSAQAKQLSLTLKTDDHLPEFIQGDQQKIRQVLNNLLSNAVKFTQTGGVKLTISAQPDGANKWRLIFAVADTGPGIPPEELEHLFENFRQGEAGRQARTGTGLGLALCWKYAALLQGRIGVQSELGKGSTFQFEVPVGIASDTPLFSAKNLTEASRPPVDASALHKNNISAKLLAALPPAWGKELREALLNADADKITGLLKAIEPHDPETAKCLLTLASEFDYENILQQLDACGLWL